MNRYWNRVAMPLVLALLLAGCGEDTESEESQEAEFCEHMQDGPAVDTQTVATTGDSPPDVSAEHTRFDLRLLETDVDVFGGVVQFAAPTAGTYVVAVNNSAMPTQLMDAQMNVVPQEAAVPNETCDEVQEQRRYVLEVGTYFIVVGPGTVSGVSIVIEEAE